MGAMKAIYTDMQELQEQAAEQQEEEFMQYLQQTGWMAPSEQEARRERALEALSSMTPDERRGAIQALKAVGVELPVTTLLAI